jgi:hypothetical protein
VDGRDKRGHDVGKSTHCVIDCGHVFQDYDVEYQFGSLAHRSGRSLFEKRAAGYPLLAGNQMP